MANERAINGLIKNPVQARNTAIVLLTLDGIEWSDWELDFLESMTGQKDELSYRQAEKLIELRDEAVRHTHASGFRFSSVIDVCWRQRDELESAEDRAFLERLKSRSETALRRRDALRLRHCAVALGHIEPYQSWSMPYARL